ncbi:plasmid mobilization relaxosome protein MobC [Gordonia otitidis]|uniref:Bacterial mobilisation domain-containing protein n=1 Tax=Gordonia otitidis (strain DSM 44809 / CCUG 52243 / JCM 12355 / NBRC 100426 / IFM 10032) TaxID=1108044 RepID=H5THI2_GORO1|nr:plasmid mobilization relaxosome protein MobC [Gordonia otitidis]GAB32940.1 hypothetical protein GOOTI_034_00070 [Gordonia otitidis NBRC 100426]
MNAFRVPVAEDAPAPVLRVRRIPLRVNDAEYDVLRAAATRAGRGQLAAWARRQLLDVATGKLPTAVANPVGREAENGVQSHQVSAVGASNEVAELARAVRELVRVGTNLNQCTRSLNSPGGDENGSWVRWLETHVGEIEAHVEAVRACAEAVRDAHTERA